MSKRVLIVDDSMLVRRQVASSLSQVGYEVREAADGVEALACVGEDHEIALIVCDINMPRMDGIQLLERLRELPFKAPAVLMLTTDGQAPLVARARALGALGWVTKPFRADHVLAIAERVTRGGAGGADADSRR